MMLLYGMIRRQYFSSLFVTKINKRNLFSSHIFQCFFVQGQDFKILKLVQECVLEDFLFVCFVFQKENFQLSFFRNV